MSVERRARRPRSASSVRLARAARTAARKVSWPRIRTRRSAWLDADAVRAPSRRSAAATGPIAPGAARGHERRAGAVAEQRRGAAVVGVDARGSSGRRRPRARRPARPASTWALARARPRGSRCRRRRGRSRRRPRRRARSATSGAALGSSSSWVSVATSTRSTLGRVDAGRVERTLAPASAARSAEASRSRSPRRRSRTPVRLTIQSSSTPRRSAIGALRTICRGQGHANRRDPCGA